MISENILCVYYHVGVSILRWCTFLHSFDTPFQNSPYGYGTDAFLTSFMFFRVSYRKCYFKQTLISQYQKHPR